MSSDYGDWAKDMRTARSIAREKFGVPCPECKRLLPKASPSILLPQQRCKIHSYRDPRPRTEETQCLNLIVDRKA